MVLVYRHQIYTDFMPHSGRTADCIYRLTDQWAAWDAVNCDILLHKVSLIEMARDHLWLNIKGSSYVSDITLTELRSSSSLSGEKQDCVQSNAPYVKTRMNKKRGAYWNHNWGVSEHLNHLRKALIGRDDDEDDVFWFVFSVVFRFSYLDVSLTGTLSRSVADRKSALK